MRISDWSSDVCSSDLAVVIITAIRRSVYGSVAGYLQYVVSTVPTFVRQLYGKTSEACTRSDLAHPLFMVRRARKSVVSGKSVSVRVELAGSRISNKKTKNYDNTNTNTDMNKSL